MRSKEIGRRAIRNIPNRQPPLERSGAIRTLFSRLGSDSRLKRRSYSGLVETLAHESKLAELMNLVPGRRRVLEFQVLGVLHHLVFQGLDLAGHFRRGHGFVFRG